MTTMFDRYVYAGGCALSLVGGVVIGMYSPFPWLCVAAYLTISGALLAWRVFRGDP